MSAARRPAIAGGLRGLLVVGLLLSASRAAPDEAEPPRPSDEEVAAARGALTSKDNEKLQERFAALQVVARTRDAALLPLLLESATGTQSPAFAVAAGEVANALDVEAAMRAFEAGRRELRGIEGVQAVRFLGEVRTPAAVRRLEALADSKDTELRVEALYGLVKQGSPGSHGKLVAALKAKERDVRVPAAVCCGLAKAADAIPVLLRGLEESGDDFAFFCAWALGQMRDPKLLDAVAAVTKGRMAGEVGFAKAKAILECAFDPQHTETLVRLCRSQHDAVAQAAAWALGQVGKDRPEAADALLELALRDDDSVSSRIAVDALGKVGGPEHGARILARYESNYAKIPAWGVKALGLLRTTQAAPLLQRIALKHKNIAIRKRAAIAFWECADEEVRAGFRKDLMEASQDRAVENLCLVLGFDRSKEGFELAVELLRKHYAKKPQRHVRDALERMTGHRFAPAPTIWKEWFAKNADFFVRQPQFLDREAWRQQILSNKLEMGISRKTEEAVERGLDWLARHQSPDGRWSGDRFFDRCDLYYRKKCQVGARLGDWDVGITGVALLAFYGAGYRPTQGRYKDTVLRAQVYTAARQWADGDFGGQGDLIGGYTRPIAAIALAEAYGTTQDPEYAERTERSVGHIVRIQYPDAGWRYRLTGQPPGDTSVTGWNAWSLATARKFGIPVDPMGLEGANSLIDLFSSAVTEDEEYYDTDPRYFFEVGRGAAYEHFTGYNAREETRPPMTAIGLICRIFMGRQRSHPYCIGAANRLLQSVPEYDERLNKVKYTAGAEYPSYYWYYGSLAMYQMGGSFWRRWSRPLLTEGIPNTQVTGDVCERGSWGCDNLDSIGGRVYTTAMCVLTLETFYRYLPALSLK